MGGRAGLAGRREVVVAVRLTEREAEEFLDSLRGALSRSAYIRWVLRRQKPAE